MTTTGAPKSDFSRGLGLAALIIGVFALLLSWIPFIGLLSLPIALIGLALGAFGMLAAIKTKSFGLPGAGMLVCAVSFGLQMYAINGVTESVVEANDNFTSYEELVSEAQAAHQKEDDEALRYATLYVEVYDIESYWGENYLGQPAAIVGFKLRNFGNKDLSDVDVTAYFEDSAGAVVSEHTFYPVLSSMGGNDGKPLRAGYIIQKRYAAKDVPTEWAGSGAVQLKVTEASLLNSK